MTRTGGCLCGAVRFTAGGIGSTFSVCHCGMCLRWVGGPAMAVEAKEVTYESTDNIAAYRSSDWAERSFCKVCGSSLAYRFIGGGPLAGSCFLQYGTLDDASGLTFGEEIFIDCKPDAFAFEGDHKRLTEDEVMAIFTAGGSV